VSIAIGKTNAGILRRCNVWRTNERNPKRNHGRNAIRAPGVEVPLVYSREVKVGYDEKDG